MTIVCPNCSARLQLADAKTPAGTFTVRCPKCQKTVDAKSAEPLPDQSGLGLGKSPATEKARFERAMPAPPFRIESEKASLSPDSSGAASLASVEDAARLLVELLHRTGVDDKKGRRRSERRRLLICSSPTYREKIARLLAENGYEVFVAEDTTQAVESMREEHMDIVILDPQFDPLEQGSVFVTREVNTLRPADRRRLFFVYLSPSVRTLDLHTAFLTNVNLVFNPSDLETLPNVLERSMREFNELYRDFNAVTQVSAL
jgi:predicted Zn finger-like uncharacterized protein